MKLLLFLVLLSYPVLSLSASAPAASYCKRTHDPKLCTSIISRSAKKGPAASGAKSVLRMHLVEIQDRCGAADKLAHEQMRKAKPNTVRSLKDCAGLYTNAVHLTAVAIGCLDKNESQKNVLQALMEEIRQSAKQCNGHFPKGQNPLAKFDGPIAKLTANCDDLNNIL